MEKKDQDIIKLADNDKLIAKMSLKDIRKVNSDLVNQLNTQSQILDVLRRENHQFKKSIKCSTSSQNELTTVIKNCIMEVYTRLQGQKRYIQE